MTSCCLHEKLLKPLPVLDQNAGGKQIQWRRRLLWPLTSEWPTWNLTQTLTALSPEPLDLITNNPTAGPPLDGVNSGGPQECAFAGSYIFKTPLIDGSLASAPYQRGHSGSQEQHSTGQFSRPNSKINDTTSQLIRPAVFTYWKEGKKVHKFLS